MSDLQAIGIHIANRLRENFPESDETTRQVLALAEEVGEFVGAFRRWAGMARRTGPWEDVEHELADVVITAYVTAAVLNIDLDTACEEKLRAVFSRGWRDKRPEPAPLPAPPIPDWRITEGRP